jgi:hypothetical protein
MHPTASGNIPEILADSSATSLERSAQPINLFWAKAVQTYQKRGHLAIEIGARCAWHLSIDMDRGCVKTSNRNSMKRFRYATDSRFNPSFPQHLGGDSMFARSTNISRTGGDRGPVRVAGSPVIRAAQGSEAPADSFSQIDLARTFSTDSAADDVTGLGLHRMAMLGGADAQPLLHRRVEVADGDTAYWDGIACGLWLHPINDCIVSILS